MRGDRPITAVLAAGQLAFTPHARGSTFLADLDLGLLTVYPACAGIDRTLKKA